MAVSDTDTLCPGTGVYSIVIGRAKVNRLAPCRGSNVVVAHFTNNTRPGRILRVLTGNHNATVNAVSPATQGNGCVHAGIVIPYRQVSVTKNGVLAINYRAIGHLGVEVGQSDCDIVVPGAGGHSASIAQTHEGICLVWDYVTITNKDSVLEMGTNHTTCNIDDVCIACISVLRFRVDGERGAVKTPTAQYQRVSKRLMDICLGDDAARQ